MNNYNSLYTSPESGYIYTQPPGDVRAQDFAGTGQGTSGEFFPIQGRAAGIFMKNSAYSNKTIPSLDPGIISGYPNYTGQTYNSSWIGFNDFGYPFSKSNGITDSYLVTGANERVLNSGQQGSLPVQDWLPKLAKDQYNFATQGSDAMVTCGSMNVNSCKGGKRFLDDKMKPQWKKII